MVSIFVTSPDPRLQKAGELFWAHVACCRLPPAAWSCNWVKVRHAGSIFCAFQRVFDWIASVHGSIKLLKHGLEKAFLLWYMWEWREDMDGFCKINFPKSTKAQRNKQIMRQRSAVFPHIFLRLHSKQPFRLYMLRLGLLPMELPGATAMEKAALK